MFFLKRYIVSRCSWIWLCCLVFCKNDSTIKISTSLKKATFPTCDYNQTYLTRRSDYPIYGMDSPTSVMRSSVQRSHLWRDSTIPKSDSGMQHSSPGKIPCNNLQIMAETHEACKIVGCTLSSKSTQKILATILCKPCL